MVKTARDLLLELDMRLVRAYARRDITSYLDKYIRPEYLEKIKLDSILDPLFYKSGAKDPNSFKDDMVDMLIDAGAGNKVLGLLLGHAEDRGFSEKDADLLVRRGSLTPDLRNALDKYRDEFGKIVYSFLRTFFTNSMKLWVVKHKREVSEEKGESVGIPPEHELEESIKQEYEWEDGLMKDVLALINAKVPKDSQGRFKAILKYRILGKDKKSQEALAKMYGVVQKTIDNDETKLEGMLREFLKAQGLGPKFDMGSKEVDVPGYIELLKADKDLQKDLKDWIKDSLEGGRSVSERTEVVLNLLAEGRSIDSIASELSLDKGSTALIKTRYFNETYKKWYQEMVEDIRKASYRMAIQAAIVHHYDDPGVQEKVEGTPPGGVPVGEKNQKKAPKEPKEPREKKDPLEKGPSKVHENMVKNIFEHNRVEVTVFFESDFDSTHGGRSGDPQFKWKEYRAEIDHTSGDHTIEYTYEDKLKDNGEFEGKPMESLLIDGKSVSGDTAIFREIHEKTQDHILKEGIIPHGHFPVSFKNTKLDKTYLGVNQFMQHNDKLFVPDAIHSKRKTDEEAFKERKRLGPYQDASDHAKITKLLGQLERNLKTEKLPENRVKIKDHIIQLKETLKKHEGDAGDDFAKIQDLIKQEKLIKNPIIVEAVDYDKISEMPDIERDMARLNQAIQKLEQSIKTEPDETVKNQMMKNLEGIKDRVKKQQDYQAYNLKQIKELIEEQKTKKLKKPFIQADDYDSISEVPGNGEVTSMNNTIDYDSILEVPENGEVRSAVGPAPLPGAKSEKALKLMSMLHSYGLTERPNPKMWMEPSDMKVMARSLRGMVEAKMKKALQSKPKGTSKEDWERQTRADYMGDLKEAVELIPEFIKDMKVRLDEYEKTHSVDHAALKARKDIEWVDDTTKVKNVIEDVTRVLSQPVSVEKELKQPGVKMIEKGKFDGLQGFLDGMLRGFHTIGDRLSALSLKPGIQNPESKGAIEELRGAKNKIQQEFQSMVQLTQEMRDKTLSKEEEKVLDDIAGEQAELRKELKELDTVLSAKEAIPATVGVKMLDAFAKYFTRLYSNFTGVLWFRSKYSVDYDALTAEDFSEIHLMDYDALTAGDALTDEDKNKKQLGDAPFWEREKSPFDKNLKNKHFLLKADRTHLYLPAKIEGDVVLLANGDWRDKDNKKHIKVEVGKTHDGHPMYRFIPESELAPTDKVLTELDTTPAHEKPQPLEKEQKEVKEKKEQVKVEEAELPGLRDKIVSQCRTLSKLHIKAKDEIKDGIKNLRGLNEKLLRGLFDVQAVAKTAVEEKEMSPEHKDRYVKYVLPENLLMHGKSIIEKMKQHDNKKVKEMVPIAEKEFLDVTHGLAKAYKEGFTDEEIKDLAKEKGITPQKAAVQLQKHRDALNKAAMDAFIIEWSDILKHALEGMPLKNKENSPLGNKPPEEYERLGKFLEDHIPEIFALSPPKGKDKLPEEGKATPKDIREPIEELWSIKKHYNSQAIQDIIKKVWKSEEEPSPEELARLWKMEVEELGSMGGGGGGKGRSRSKAVRPNPPSAVIEQIKAHTAKMVQTMDPEDVVLTVLMSYVHRIKKEIAGLKADEHIEVDAIVDALVHILKQLHTTMINLKVHPSAKQFTLPPPGAPAYSGTPDIPIDSYKDVQHIFDQYKGIIDNINHYLEPHKIGIPPQSLKSIRKVNRYLPSEFADWATWYEKHEGKSIPRGPQESKGEKWEPLPHNPSDAEKKVNVKPKVPSYTGHAAGEELLDYSTQLSYNVAAKFAGIELSDDEFEAVIS